MEQVDAAEVSPGQGHRSPRPGSWDCLKMAPPPRGLSAHSFLPGIPSFGAPSLRALATLSGYPLLSWTRVERNQGVNSEGKATAFPVWGTFWRHLWTAKFGRQEPLRVLSDPLHARLRQPLFSGWGTAGISRVSTLEELQSLASPRVLSGFSQPLERAQ